MYRNNRCFETKHRGDEGRISVFEEPPPPRGFNSTPPPPLPDVATLVEFQMKLDQFERNLRFSQIDRETADAKANFWVHKAYVCCGHTFCTPCIDQLTGRPCSVCRLVITDTKPNFGLAELSARYSSVGNTNFKISFPDAIQSLRDSIQQRFKEDKQKYMKENELPSWSKPEVGYDFRGPAVDPWNLTASIRGTPSTTLAEERDSLRAAVAGLKSLGREPQPGLLILECAVSCMFAKMKRMANEDALRKQLGEKDAELTAIRAQLAEVDGQLARQMTAIRGVIAEIGRCPACWDHMDAPQVTGCGHTFCQECMTKCREEELPVCRGVVRRPVRNFGSADLLGRLAGVLLPGFGER
ncbi:unnamed protein product [Caenorhabditis brenneri]